MSMLSSNWASLFVTFINTSINSTSINSVTVISHNFLTVYRGQGLSKNDGLWQVELVLTSDNDLELRHLTDRIREETFPDSHGRYRLVQLLIKLGK
jgi:hypothetical protein